MSARDTSPSGAALKLRARDADDLQTIARCLQDALIPLGDIAYLKSEKRFVMVANRFRWEGAPDEARNSAQPLNRASEDTGDAHFEDADSDSGALYERVNCGLCFDSVDNVKFRGVDLRDRNQILSVLTLTYDPDAITIVFSGGAEIRLEVGKIRCHLDDLGEPWPTRWRPGHDIDDAKMPEPG
jgi:DUF2948 family protein